MSPRLNIALPKGRLLPPSVELLAQAGLLLPDAQTLVKMMVTQVPESDIRVFVIRDDDVPTYVTQGAGDLGIVGKDVLLEKGGDVIELFDLRHNPCRLVVAVPEEYRDQYPWSGTSPMRVATKYPRLTADFFRQRGINANIITVHGSTELTPAVGLADAVVDLVASGSTLKENRLVEVDEILASTARLIANPVSYRLRSDLIWPLVDQLRQLVNGAGAARE